MEIGWLILATVLAATGGFLGWRRLRNEQPSGIAFWWMIAVFGCQTMALGWRGDLRGQCPLGDAGEICLFLAWSLTLFYLVTGSTYRLSFLGIFTIPFVILLQAVALIPGAFEKSPEKVQVLDPWKEAHAPLAVLSYGALGLAAVAGIMFLILDRRLKDHKLEGNLVHGLPSIHRLGKAMGRVALVGWIVLTAGVVTGFLVEGGTMNAHLLAPLITWVLYAVLLGVYFVRGLPGRQLAIGVTSLFVVSLLVFGKL